MTQEPTQSFAARISPYVPRMLQQRLASHPDDRAWTAEGTAVFVDVSGFTQLSERLARKGREGSEQIADAIGGSFESILLVAYENGASLLKFGGDSLLLWFERSDHVVRGCRACVLMRRVLRTAGRITLPGAQTTLRMTQGVHSGTFHFFAAGTSHLELLPVGPAWTTVVAMEHAAESGEIVVSARDGGGAARTLPRRRARRGSAPPARPGAARAGDTAHAASADSRRAACPLPAGRGSRARVARQWYPGASARHDRLRADRAHRRVTSSSTARLPRPTRSIA